MNSDPRRHRRLFWLLAPVVAGFVALMALAQSGDATWTLSGVLVELGLGLAVATMMLKLWHPERFWWAGRALAALVFVAYAAYFVSELLDPQAKFHLIEPRAHASLRNAALGLVLFGGTGLWFASTGRLPWQRVASVARPDAPEA